jgi:RNA polymerase sigma factor (sigma-70 family)
MVLAQLQLAASPKLAPLPLPCTPQVQRSEYIASTSKRLLLAHNARLVFKVAHRYVHKGRLPMTDLVTAGITGLERAVDKFDLSRPLALSTYAYPWVMAAMQRAEETQSLLLGVPCHTQHLGKRLRGHIAEAAEQRRMSEQEALQVGAALLRLARAAMPRSVAALSQAAGAGAAAARAGLAPCHGGSSGRACEGPAAERLTHGPARPPARRSSRSRLAFPSSGCRGRWSPPASTCRYCGSPRRARALACRRMRAATCCRCCPPRRSWRAAWQVGGGWWGWRWNEGGLVEPGGRSSAGG